MNGVPSTEQLWDLFWRYEQDARIGTAEYRHAAATMADAIARILVSREETSTYSMFRNRSKPA